MFGTTPPEIRYSYTPLERAILSAYLGYPDPAPDELEGIDITKTVDPDEWDESVQGIAPLPNLYETNHLTIENAVARICLEPVAPELPQWLSVRDDRVTLARSGRRCRALRSHRPQQPNHLFTINWATIAPGLTWPEKYYTAHLPGYDVCVVTGSGDSPDAQGYCEFALGWYLGGVSEVEKAGEFIRAWWSRQLHHHRQARWAYLFGTGAVDKETAERWADEVWPRGG
jgi:hypothetical protein